MGLGSASIKSSGAFSDSRTSTGEPPPRTTAPRRWAVPPRMLRSSPHFRSRSGKVVVVGGVGEAPDAAPARQPPRLAMARTARTPPSGNQAARRTLSRCARSGPCLVLILLTACTSLQGRYVGWCRSSNPHCKMEMEIDDSPSRGARLSRRCAKHRSLGYGDKDRIDPTRSSGARS
jgi:hypothetical protein